MTTVRCWLWKQWTCDSHWQCYMTQYSKQLKYTKGKHVFTVLFFSFGSLKQNFTTLHQCWFQLINCLQLKLLLFTSCSRSSISNWVDVKFFHMLHLQFNKCSFLLSMFAFYEPYRTTQKVFRQNSVNYSSTERNKNAKTAGLHILKSL